MAAEYDGEHVVGLTTGPSLPGLLASGSCAAVDIPVGLPERWGTVRPVDARVRTLLPRYGSRVFSVLSWPQQLHAAQLAPAWAAWLSGRRGRRPALPTGFTLQSLFLAPKVVATNSWVTSATPTANVTVEAHPEASFALMGGGAPVAASKKTKAGRQHRERLLSSSGMTAATCSATVKDFREVLGVQGGVRPADDDILDAVACAWTAWRVWSTIVADLPGAQVHCSGPDGTHVVRSGPAGRPPIPPPLRLTTRGVIWH